jgi:phage terminase large subunit-like protein
LCERCFPLSGYPEEATPRSAPVLQWCPPRSSPAGGRKFDKAKSTGRIDALVALAMALSLALLRAEEQIDIRALIG